MAFLIAHTKATAQTVMALDPGSPVVVNSVPNASLGASNTGTTGKAGYEFFTPYNETTGSRADVVAVPSFVTGVDYDLTSANAASGGTSYTTQEYSGSYSQLQIGGVGWFV